MIASTQIEVSTCCKASPIEAYRTNLRDHHDSIPIYLCSKCEDECEVEGVCEFCLGTGIVATDEDDGEGHTMIGVGSEKCIDCVK